MKLKRTITYGVAAAFTALTLTNTPTALADSGSQLKSTINHLENKRQTTLNDLQSNKQDLNANQKQQSSLMNQVQALESQIVSSDNKILAKQNSIQTTQQNIQMLKDNMAQVQKRIQQRKTIIEDRARSVYVNGDSTSYLQLMLDANNFFDLVNRVVFVNKIAQQDHAILIQQVEDKQRLAKYQKALQITLNQLNSDLDSLKQMKASLASKKEKEQTLLNQLKNKATKIQQAVYSQQREADLYQQQVAANKQLLAQWESEQRQSVGSINASGVPQVVQQFISPAQSLQRTTGIPASITLAQITLESVSGGQLSDLASSGKNLFGIKGTGPAGTINLSTHEVIGGMDLTITAGFKCYQTFYQGMVDHAQILQLPRYQYFLKNANSLKEFAYGIQNGGYSTDPLYAVKLLDIIQSYGLNRFDVGNF